MVKLKFSNSTFTRKRMRQRDSKLCYFFFARFSCKCRDDVWFVAHQLRLEELCEFENRIFQVNLRNEDKSL